MSVIITPDTGANIVTVISDTGNVLVSIVDANNINASMDPVTISRHNNLVELQGGTSNQYYHMTQNQYNNNVYRYDLPVYQTGAQTISGIKTFADKTFVSGLKFQVLTGNQVPVHEQGLMFYDDANHTINLYVDNPDVTLQLGQENWVRVKNTLNAPILDGDLVYIAGGVGANPYVQLAIAGGENTSAATLGMATHDIGNNEFGYITTFGLVNNINTNGYNVGDTLYLSPTQSGKYTNVKPQAPQHMVRVGTVIRANANNGVIFVNIQNGLEIDELHDVRIINKQDKQALLYDSASGLWLNRGINTGDISGLYDFIVSTEGEFLTKAEGDSFYVSLTGDQNISGVKNFVEGTTFLQGLDASFVSIDPSLDGGNNLVMAVSNTDGEAIFLQVPSAISGNQPYNIVDFPRFSGELITNQSVIDTGTLYFGQQINLPYFQSGAEDITNVYIKDAFNFKYSRAEQIDITGGALVSDNYSLWDLHKKAYDASTAVTNNTNSINELDSLSVKITGNQTISGQKYFLDPIAFGTTNTSGQLNVVGNANISGVIKLGTNLTGSTIAGTQQIVLRSDTTSTSNHYTNFTSVDVSPTANNSALYYATYSAANLNNSSNISRLVAFQGQANHLSSGTITQARGMAAVVQNSSSGSITSAYGSLSAILNVGAGTITNAFGAYVQNVANTGPITNKTAITLDNVTNGTNNTNLLIGTSTVPSGNYSIYNSSAYNNYFAGLINANAGISAPYVQLNDSYLTTRIQLASFSNPVIVRYVGEATAFVAFGQTVNGATNGFATSDGGVFCWSNSYTATSSKDLQLYRDAAGTLAQRNGVNAQAFRIYGTYTSATNFERLNLRYNSTDTAFQIATEKGADGGTARALELQTDNITRLKITTAGDVGINQSSPTEKLDVNGNIVGNIVYEYNGVTKERLATQNFAIAMAIALS